LKIWGPAKKFLYTHTNTLAQTHTHTHTYTHTHTLTHTRTHNVLHSYLSHASSTYAARLIYTHIDRREAYQPATCNKKSDEST
jgi:hypothetical protein